MFTTMLEYKGRWYDCLIHKVDRFFASSQTCSECGTKNPQVKDLSVREWVCICGVTHNRDINASKNLLNQGKLELGIKQDFGSDGVSLKLQFELRNVVLA